MLPFDSHLTGEYYTAVAPLKYGRLCTRLSHILFCVDTGSLYVALSSLFPIYQLLLLL